MYTIFIPVEEHHAHRLRELPDDKGAQSGKTHKKILVEHMSADQVLACCGQHLQTQDQIGNYVRKQAQRQTEQHRTHPVQDQAQCKQACAKQDRL